MVVTATWLDPSGRRTHDTAIVQCVFGCGGVHLHRMPNGPAWRRAGCGAGTYYVVPANEAVNAA